MNIDLLINDTPMNIRLIAAADELREDAKLAAKAPSSDIPDDEDVERLCKLLTALPSTDVDVLNQFLPKVPLPTGFRHFRLFDAATGLKFASTHIDDDAPALDVHDIVCSALESPLCEVTSWSATRRCPVVIPGVLDLDLDMTTKVRVPKFGKLPK